ncbi:response regulator [Geomonas sp. RF6]|uniref:hybrid sensor histidine kinase/response regulator n=1 Tax=Geomonas sp. RF6 TaxID=2897342 RepID=UPI001E4233E1|nr:hybrid sensor histidine kinase/response regulator [Geomonas sp. RF6]UFS69623.1 response regulator [Geomonas sp. RF6]
MITRSSMLLVLLAELLGVAFLLRFISAKLQRRLLDPVRALVQRMEIVAGGKGGGSAEAPRGYDELTLLLTRLEGIITGLADGQAAMAQRSEELEGTVAERTEELSAVNRQLAESLEEVRTAMQQAQALSRTKSDFLAQMSHEIRTPMYAVLGMTELLMNTELSAEQSRFVETVRRSGEALLTIINNILDISKIEAGKMELEIIPFDLGETVADAVQLFCEDAQKKGLVLSYHLDPALPRSFCGDAGRLRQVLVNLVANAVKFTHQGKVDVLVAPAPEAGLVLFQVRDSGIGIEREVQASIFDHFSQADQSMTRRYGGTGLGLAIARQLTELMGGEIGVESEPGQGSTFFFTAHLEPVSECHPASLDAESSLVGKRLLIVGGDGSQREVLLRQAAVWGMEADAAKSSSQALRMIGSAPYDLAILDEEGPEGGGITLARAISNHPAGRWVRLVLLTPAGGAPDAEILNGAGIVSSLQKPVQQGALYEALVCALGMELPAGWGGEGKMSASLSSPLVLVVEDNEVNQEVGRGMLESLGCRVEIAENGIKAIEAVQQKEYDLVFMDCQMPEMDGLEATRTIRSWEKGRRTTIISLTAYAMQGDKERCLAAGADDYLTKPFSRSELSRLLAKYLNGEHTAGGERPPAHEAGLKAPTSRNDAGAGTIGAGAPAAPPPAATAGLDPHSTIPIAAREHVDPSIPSSAPALEIIKTLPGKRGMEILRKVVQLYLDSTPTLLETLREAQSGGDAEKLKAAAHSFKSSSANLGAVRLAGACSDLEALGRAGSTQGALPLLMRVEEEYLAVRDALSGGSLC